LEEIKEILLREGIAYVAALAPLFNVSKTAIQRDFNFFQEEGWVRHEHGRAIVIATPPAALHALTSVESKVAQSAAEAVAQLIRDDGTIILDGGAFSLQLVQYVPKDSQAIVITNSPVVAIAFSSHPKVVVRMIGGELRGGAVIPIREGEYDILKLSRPYLCVLGLCHLDLKEVTTSDPEEADLRGVMMDQATQVVVPVSIESLGSKSNFLVGPLKKITHIIPDSSVPNKKLKPYENLGIKIIRG
jgi:DeoR/GlpR family transcriptional regulator of sugar metabolism